MSRLALHWQIAIALVLAAIAGTLTADNAGAMEVYSILGTLFLNALKMLIVPLIVSAIVGGMLALEKDSLGRLGGKTVLYYGTTTLIATLIGLLVLDVIQPGIIDGAPAGPRLGLSADTGKVVAAVAGRGLGDIAGLLESMIPANLFVAAAQGEMLGLIFFSLLFGGITARLPERHLRPQREFWTSLYEAMIGITEVVMKFAPLGVFGLVAKTVAATGFQAIQPLALFFFSVLLGLAIHTFVILSLILKFLGRVRPGLHLQAMSPVLLMAFSTSSSSATLPVTIEHVQKGAGVSPQVSGFVLPLGATVNMNGTALYECAAAIFIAQAYGLELSIFTQFTVVLLALVTSIGVAGIPAASLVAIAVILGAVGLPIEGVGLILAVDRVLDMCRTAVNVYGDTVGAVVIARLEGEDGILGEPALKK